MTRRSECLDVKSVREPDDRNGHVRFDERAPETELWRGLRHRRVTRKRPETATPRAPKNHRAGARLYQRSYEFYEGKG
jgi:hypothetical protein